MSRTIDPTAALRVLERAARRARSSDAETEIQKHWAERTEESFTWRGNRTAVAALGTALLAKATDGDVDALSLKPESGTNGYAARTLARTVLAANREAYGFALGTPASDPLANSPWFGGDLRIDLITKWRPTMRQPAAELVTWLSGLTAADAPDALVGFLRVCMRRHASEVESNAAGLVSGAVPSMEVLSSTLQSLVVADAEEGRIGTAVCAAAYSAAGHAVEARAVNAPGQTDVDVKCIENEIAIGIEVKQKPATAQDGLDIAAGSAAVGASRALLAALDPRQIKLDDDRLADKAETSHGVVLAVDYNVPQVLRRAFFSSAVTRAQFLDRYPAEFARWLVQLGASEGVRLRWKTIVERWAEE